MILQKSKAGEESFMVLLEMKVKEKKTTKQCTYFQHVAFFLTFLISFNLEIVCVLIRDLFFKY